MRRAPFLAALLLALAAHAAPCRAERPSVLVGPVIVEPVDARPGAEPWRRTVSRRLADRFRVVLPERAPADLETALSLARAGRIDYVAETRYTRIGAFASLDIAFFEPSGRVVDSVTVEGSVDSSGEGGKDGDDVPRLSISASARIARKVLGDGGDAPKGGGRGTAPPAGILERSPAHEGRPVAAAFLPSGGGKGSMWAVADGGAVRFFPAGEGGKGAAPPSLPLPAGGADPLLAGGDGDGDGQPELFVGTRTAAGPSTAVYRLSKGAWGPVGDPLPLLPVRLAGKTSASVLLSLFPSGDAWEPGLLVSPTADDAPRRAGGGKGGTGVAGTADGAIPVVDGEGRIGTVRVDGDGRIRHRSGGGEERGSIRPAGTGKIGLYPADLDGDGADEVLVVEDTTRPGSFFESVAVPSGSRVACYSLSPATPPLLRWRISVPDTGIAAAGVDRDGSLHFLLAEPAPRGGGSFRFLRVR